MLRQVAKSVARSTAAVVDRAATIAAYAGSKRRRRRNNAETLGHRERLKALSDIQAQYTDVTEFFMPPTALTPSRQRVRGLAGGHVEDLRWATDYQSFLPGATERYQQGGGAPATRLWRHREPRSTLILVHGYMAGQHHVEERVWPSQWLFKQGFDLAFYVLPHHGVRSTQKRWGAPRFPGNDPRVTNEGFRQAMHELQSLVTWLHANGHAQVGVMGMSLGGYTTSLLATVEPRLRCAVPIIPLSSIADFARDQGRLGSNAVEEEREHQALDAVHHIVSPLHREPVLASDRMLIIAAEADRITPIRHARRLGAHFGVPVETWHGGHLLQFGRSDKFRQMGRFLRASGMLDAR